MLPVTPDSALVVIQKKTRAAVLARLASLGLPQPVPQKRAGAETHVKVYMHLQAMSKTQ